jgi:hypothetical protein
MPTQRNYNKYKDSILKDIHQGKDIDLLSTEYSIPQPLIEEWIEKGKQDSNPDVFISELSSQSLDRMTFFEKVKRHINISHFKRTLPYLVCSVVIVIGITLASLSMYKICDVANPKEDISLKLDTILKSHKKTGSSIIYNEEQKLVLLKDIIHILNKIPSVGQPVEVRRVYHKQVYLINNSNIQNDSI